MAGTGTRVCFVEALPILVAHVRPPPKPRLVGNHLCLCESTFFFDSNNQKCKK